MPASRAMGSDCRKLDDLATDTFANGSGTRGLARSLFESGVLTSQIV